MEAQVEAFMKRQAELESGGGWVIGWVLSGYLVRRASWGRGGRQGGGRVLARVREGPATCRMTVVSCRVGFSCPLPKNHRRNSASADVYGHCLISGGMAGGRADWRMCSSGMMVIISRRCMLSPPTHALSPTLLPHSRRLAPKRPLPERATRTPSIGAPSTPPYLAPQRPLPERATRTPSSGPTSSLMR